MKHTALMLWFHNYRKFERILLFGGLAICIHFSLFAQSHKIHPNEPELYYKTNRPIIETVSREAGFVAGECIADIGAGTGLFDVFLSIFTDSLVFYLEDIDSSFFDQENFNRALQYAGVLRGRDLTSIFKFLQGSEISTGLPGEFFDKVLVIDSYHHFKYRRAMMEDLYRILKKGGKLLIYDLLAKKENDIHPICHTRIFNRDEMINQMQFQGFTFEQMIYMKRKARHRTGLFIFFK